MKKLSVKEHGVVVYVKELASKKNVLSQELED